MAKMSITIRNQFKFSLGRERKLERDDRTPEISRFAQKSERANFNEVGWQILETNMGMGGLYSVNN